MSEKSVFPEAHFYQSSASPSSPGSEWSGLPNPSLWNSQIAGLIIFKGSFWAGAPTFISPPILLGFLLAVPTPFSSYPPPLIWRSLTSYAVMSLYKLLWSMVTVSTPNSQIIDKHRGLNGVKLYLWYLHPSAAHVAPGPRFRSHSLAVYWEWSVALFFSSWLGSLPGSLSGTWIPGTEGFKNEQESKLNKRKHILEPGSY